MSDTQVNNHSSVSIGFGGLLLVVLVVLKLNPGGHLDSPVEDWSWWLVIFAPFLIGLAIFLAGLLMVGLIVLIGMTIAWVIDARKARKREKARLERLKRADRPTDLK